MTEVQEKPAFVGRRPSIPYHAIGGRAARQNPTIADGCPCCGAAMKAARPFVDLNTNHLIVGNKTVALGPIEAKLAEILVRRMPGVVSHDALIMSAWDDEPDDALGNLKVQMRYLRQKSELLGISVVAVYTVGYRMVLQ